MSSYVRCAVANPFIIIAVTTPGPLPGEAALIRRMLYGGIHRVHVRKPEATEQYVRALLDEIPAQLHSRISLHDYHCLINAFPGVHVHLNARNPHPPACGPWSRSCHAEVELHLYSQAQYLFLSPVFDSISKPGYTAGFGAMHISANVPVVALGGVTPQRFEELRLRGFAGAAMLGWLWEGDLDTKLKLIRQYQQCCNS